MNILFELIPKHNLLFLWYELNLFKIVPYMLIIISKGISLIDKYSLNEFFYLLRLTNLGPDLLVADDTGHLYRISWDGSVHQHLTISLNTLSYTTSLNSDRSLFNMMRIIHLNILL